MCFFLARSAWFFSCGHCSPQISLRFHPFSPPQEPFKPPVSPALYQQLAIVLLVLGVYFAGQFFVSVGAFSAKTPH